MTEQPPQIKSDELDEIAQRQGKDGRVNNKTTDETEPPDNSDEPGERVRCIEGSN